MKRNAKWKADKILAAAEAKLAKHERIRQAEATMQVQHSMVIATFAKRAKDVAIASDATTKEGAATGQAAPAEARQPLRTP